MAIANGNENLPVKSAGNAPSNTIKALFESKKSSIAAIIPKHVDPERLIKVALVAISRTPLLMKCSPPSLLQSFMTAAQLGLDVGGTLGSAYLVPYRNNKTGSYEAQFIVGYRGLIDLARRSGQIESIEARVVREGDEFEVEYGLTPRLVHKPNMERMGKMIAVYGIARLKGGETQVEVMSRAQVEAIRDRSRASGNGPWVTDFDEMARKTVIRRLAKYLPLTIEPLHEAIQKSDEAEYGDVMTPMFDALPEPAEDAEATDEPTRQSKSSRLAKSLKDDGGETQMDFGAEGESEAQP